MKILGELINAVFSFLTTPFDVWGYEISFFSIFIVVSILSAIGWLIGKLAD